MEVKHCSSYEKALRAQLTRRALFGGGLLGATLLLQKSALAKSLFRANGNVVVVVFLRGGADGLSLVVPYAEESYYRARPTLAVARPGQGASAGIKLDDRFALHPTLSPLMPLYESGKLACVHAVGSQDRTRSHFEAMSAMERGAARDGEPINEGWLARYLQATSELNAPLRAIGFGATVPESLNGATQAVALESLENYRLEVSQENRAKVTSLLARLFESESDPYSQAGRNTLKALEAVGDYDSATSKPEGGAQYPDTSLGNALKQVAYLVRKDVGLEIACVDAADRGGWDTHVAQGPWINGLLEDLAGSLAAFARDLDTDMSRVTLVVQTEFGRRVAENSGYGTDHGRASVMFAMGGGVRGGKVYADWPGLSPESLEGPGDLRVTTDYRDVLGEMLSARLGHRDVSGVFPGHSARPVEVFG